MRLLVSIFIGCFLVMSFKMAAVEDDVSLVNLKKSLPPTWHMIINGDTLKIENPEPVWQLNANFINAPIDAYQDDEENATRILTNGETTTAHFYFLLKPKKSISKAEKKSANYFSSNYALFFVEGAGYDTPYARCYPWHLENEATLIYNVTLRNNLVVGTGPVYPEVIYNRP